MRIYFHVLKHPQHLMKGVTVHYIMLSSVSGVSEIKCPLPHLKMIHLQEEAASWQCLLEMSFRKSEICKMKEEAAVYIPDSLQIQSSLSINVNRFL